MTIRINSKMPTDSFIIGESKSAQFQDYLGKNIVLYFYPKDNTPGCTQESEDFRDNFLCFKKHNTIILGVSRDSIKSHKKFKDKYELPFDLIADTNGDLCSMFGVIKNKSMFGKTYLGIERSTFLIDDSGHLRQEWRKVKVSGHVQEVLKTISDLYATLG